MADPKRKQIEDLKRRLKGGKLPAAQREKIAARIRGLGGKVVLKNFPPAKDAPPVEPGGGRVPPPPPPLNRPTPQPPAPGSKQSVRAELEAGAEFGREIGQEFFAEGSLGRLETGRSEEIKELIELRRANLEGLTPEEQRQIRERAEIDANRQAQQSRRNLIKRLASTNQRGAVAAGLLGDIDRERFRAQRGITSDVFSENIDRKRAALGEFGSLLTGQQAFEQGTNVFNLNQRAAEVGGRAGAVGQGIGLFGGIAAGQRGEAFAQEQFTFQQEEAERIRKQQLEILRRQQKFQKNLFNQGRADAGAF